MPESFQIYGPVDKCGEIDLNMSNAVNITEYVLNITCLNKLGLYITLNLPKYYVVFRICLGITEGECFLIY